MRERRKPDDEGATTDLDALHRRLVEAGAGHAEQERRLRQLADDLRALSTELERRRGRTRPEAPDG